MLCPTFPAPSNKAVDDLEQLLPESSEAWLWFDELTKLEQKLKVCNEE